MERVLQQSLFEEFDLDRRRDLTLATRDWSPSKRSQLEQCPRRYYYQYYGNPTESNGSGAPLQFYRKLSNSWMLAGILLHVKIKESFGIWRKGGMVDSKSLVKDVSRRWQRVKESSLQFMRSSDYFKPPPGVLLYPHNESSTALIWLLSPTVN